MDNSQSTGSGLGGLPPALGGIEPVVPQTPNVDGSGQSLLSADIEANKQVEPVPLPKVTDAEKPVEPAATMPQAAAPAKEEANPLFEKPITVAPGGKEGEKEKNEKGHGLSKTVVAGIAGLVFLVVMGIGGGLYLLKTPGIGEVRRQASGTCPAPDVNTGACAIYRCPNGCSGGQCGDNRGDISCDATIGGDCGQVDEECRRPDGSTYWRLKGGELNCSGSCDGGGGGGGGGGGDGPGCVGLGNPCGGDNGSCCEGLFCNPDGRCNTVGDDFSGAIVSAQCTGIQEESGRFIVSGWAGKNNDLVTQIEVEMWRWSQKGNKWIDYGGAVANRRTDSAVCRQLGGGGGCSVCDTAEGDSLPKCNHGFSFDVPSDVSDGRKYMLEVWGNEQEVIDTTEVQCTVTTPTPTPTPVVTAAHCESLVGQVSDGDGGWTSKTDSEFAAAARPGDNVRFMCTGVKPSGIFTKAAFFINDILHVDDVVKLNDTQFAVEYTISGAGQLKVGSVLLHDSQGWVD